MMSSKIRKMVAAAVVASVLPAVSSLAAPYVDLRLVGRNVTTGQVGYTSTVSASPGDTIALQLTAQLAPVGTANPNPSGTANDTILTETPGTDGINSLKFNVFDPEGASASVGDDLVTNLSTPFTLQSSWTAGTGPSGGVASVKGDGSKSLDNVRPIQGAGIFVGVNGSPSIIGDSSMTIASMINGGKINVAMNQPGTVGALTSGFKVNGASITSGSGTESNGADPLVAQFNAAVGNANTASLTIIPVPEPASFGLLGLAATGLFRRRRSR